jgi:hypothetical protein
LPQLPYSPPIQPLQPAAPIQMQQTPGYPTSQMPPNPSLQTPNVSNSAAAESLSQAISKLDSGNSSTAPAVKIVASGPLISAKSDSTNRAGEPVEGAPIYTDVPR